MAGIRFAIREVPCRWSVVEVGGQTRRGCWVSNSMILPAMVGLWQRVDIGRDVRRQTIL